ncbi:hypothetical protein [Yeosuana sp. AK3]
MKKLALTSVFALTSLIACKDETKKDLANTENVPGINLEFMDTSVKPSEDFFLTSTMRHPK